MIDIPVYIAPEPPANCNHANAHEQVFDNSHEEWHNGIATWVKDEGSVKICDDCGSIYNPETGRWER